MAKNDLDFYKDYLEKTLSEKRFYHSVCVAEEASRLAKENNFDEEKAYLAGLLHDVCKEKSADEQYALVLKSKTYVDPEEKRIPALYHAIAGSVFVESCFPEDKRITDEDIINAIRYHTVARKDMSTLEKIIHLADFVSMDRDYKDVKKYRKFVHKSLDLGMIETLKYTLEKDLDKGNTLVISSCEAYNEYINKGEKI